MKISHIIITASALGLISAQAATIAWSSELTPMEGALLDQLSSGLFDTSGTLVLAENSGSNTATTFDGISFAAATISFGNVYGGFGSNGGELLNRTGTYGSEAQTVSLTVVDGQQYRIQALVYDGRGGEAGRNVEFDSIDQGVYANGVPSASWGPGLLVTGIFTADSTTQDFTINTYEGATVKGGQLNAITVYDVPEPSSAALLGLGGLALILRRRK